MPRLRWLTFALALLAAGLGTGAPATGQIPQVERLELVDHGVFQLQTGSRTPAPGTATGSAAEGEGATLIERTGRVPARAGVSFGIRFRVVGPGNGDFVFLDAVWLFPEPGMANHATGKAYRRQTTNMRVALGTLSGSFYLFEEPWELLPGTWGVEIWQGRRKLLEQAFTVYRP